MGKVKRGVFLLSIKRMMSIMLELKDSRFQVQFIPPRNDGQGVLLIQALID
jgi:hypothetical protein